MAHSAEAQDFPLEVVRFHASNTSFFCSRNHCIENAHSNLELSQFDLLFLRRTCFLSAIDSLIFCDASKLNSTYSRAQLQGMPITQCIWNNNLVHMIVIEIVMLVKIE